MTDPQYNTQTMIKKLLPLWLLLALAATYFFCTEDDFPDIPPDPVPDTISAPTNLRVDSVRIIDTGADSTLSGRFRAQWSPVAHTSPDTIKYLIYLYDGAQNYIDVFITKDTTYIFEGLTINQTYWVNYAAFKILVDPTSGAVTDTLYSNRPNIYQPARLWQPKPPKLKSISYDGFNAMVSWYPYDSLEVLSYLIFLRDSVGTTIDSLSAAATDSVALIPAQKNRAYKISISTTARVSKGAPYPCSTWIYSDPTTLDSLGGYDSTFVLPHAYLSTFDTMPPISIATSSNYELLGIRGGLFAMGDIWQDKQTTRGQVNGPGKPVHEVFLSSFYLGRQEISNSQYVAFLNSLDTLAIHLYVDSTTDTIEKVLLKRAPDSLVDTLINLRIPGQPIYRDTLDSLYKCRVTSLNLPTAGVYWVGAARFCNYLSTIDSKESCYNDSLVCDFAKSGYRLPTEAEYEYAQSGSYLNNWSRKRRYPWGYNSVETQFNHNTGQGSSVLKVVTTPPTINGFYALSGNIMEWCNDKSDTTTADTLSLYYMQSLQSGLAINPTGIDFGLKHVLRGGSYLNFKKLCTSSWRHLSESNSYADCGFRVVRKAGP